MGNSKASNGNQRSSPGTGDEYQARDEQKVIPALQNMFDTKDQISLCYLYRLWRPADQKGWNGGCEPFHLHRAVDLLNADQYIRLHGRQAIDMDHATRQAAGPSDHTSLDKGAFDVFGADRLQEFCIRGQHNGKLKAHVRAAGGNLPQRTESVFCGFIYL